MSETDREPGWGRPVAGPQLWMVVAGSLDIAAFDVYASARHVRTVVDSTPSVRHRSARDHGTYPSAACCRVRPATTTRARRLKPTDLSRPNAERIEVLGSSTHTPAVIPPRMAVGP